jgi:glutamyl-tRNA synthetase
VLSSCRFARRYKGKLIVRFDDTNPSKEKEEYQQAIIEDLAKLEVVPDVGSTLTHNRTLPPTLTLSFLFACPLLRARFARTQIVTYTSDYFEQIREYALDLVREGKAFMDDTPQEAMQAERMARQNSSRRDLSVEDNLKCVHNRRVGGGAGQAFANSVNRARSGTSRSWSPAPPRAPSGACASR